MVLFIAGDIGGTNSRLQLLRASPRQQQCEDTEAGAGEALLAEEIYPSTKHKSMEEIIRIFLDKYNPQEENVYCMCLAVAGPVTDNKARVTNLPWDIDGASLAKTFQLHDVRIINDFVGIGYGLLALGPNDLQVLHAPTPGTVVDPKGVRAVIGAGTGLGECFLTHNGKHYDVWPSEGGHTDFAPRTKLEFEILEHIKKTENLHRVSVERVTSGLGLPKIYAYLAQKSGNGNASVAARIASGKEDVGRVIAEAASSGACPVCVETMDVFVQGYGAEAGNLCLKTLPFGGLYIAGGIAAKNLGAMKKNHQFVAHYHGKGRFKIVLDRIPIYLITHPQVGLLGSKVICRRFIHEAKLPVSKL